MDIFENVKKNFDFGCMRLPMKDGEVDTEEFTRQFLSWLQCVYVWGYCSSKDYEADPTR